MIKSTRFYQNHELVLSYIPRSRLPFSSVCTLWLGYNGSVNSKGQSQIETSSTPDIAGQTWVKTRLACNVNANQANKQATHAQINVCREVYTHTYYYCLPLWFNVMS